MNNLQLYPDGEFVKTGYGIDWKSDMSDKEKMSFRDFYEAIGFVSAMFLVLSIFD